METAGRIGHLSIRLKFAAVMGFRRGRSPFVWEDCANFKVRVSDNDSGVSHLLAGRQFSFAF